MSSLKGRKEKDQKSNNLYTSKFREESIKYYIMYKNAKNIVEECIARLENMFL